MIDDKAKCDPHQFNNDILVKVEQEVHRSLGKVVTLRHWNNGFEMALEFKIEYLDNLTGIVIVSKGI